MSSGTSCKASLACRRFIAVRLHERKMINLCLQECSNRPLFRKALAEEAVLKLRDFAEALRVHEAFVFANSIEGEAANCEN